MGRDLDYITKMKEHVNQLGVKTISPSIYRQLKTDIKGPIDSQYFFKNPYDLAKYEVNKHAALRRLEMLNNLWVQNMTLRIDAKDPTYIPWAKSKLKEMKARMMLQGIDIMNKNWIVQGQHIFCQSASGYDYIRITGEVPMLVILFFVSIYGEIAALAITVDKTNGTFTLKKIKYDVPIESIDISDRWSVQSSPGLSKHSVGLSGYESGLPTLLNYGIGWKGYTKLYIPTIVSTSEEPSPILNYAFTAPTEEQSVAWEAKYAQTIWGTAFSIGRKWIELDPSDSNRLEKANIHLSRIGGQYGISYQDEANYKDGTYIITPITLPSGVGTHKSYQTATSPRPAPTCEEAEGTLHTPYGNGTLVYGSNTLVSISSTSFGEIIAVMRDRPISKIITGNVSISAPTLETLAAPTRHHVLVREFLYGCAPPEGDQWVSRTDTGTAHYLYETFYSPSSTSSTHTDIKIGDTTIATFETHTTQTNNMGQIIHAQYYSCEKSEGGVAEGSCSPTPIDVRIISDTTTYRGAQSGVSVSTTTESGEAFSHLIDYDYSLDLQDYIFFSEYRKFESSSTSETPYIIDLENGVGFLEGSSTSHNKITTKWRILSSKGDFTLDAGKVAESIINNTSTINSIHGTVISGISCHVNKYNMTYTYLVREIDNIGNPTDVIRRVFGIINLDSSIVVPVGHRAEFSVTENNYTEFFYGNFPHFANAAIGVHKV